MGRALVVRAAPRSVQTVVTPAMLAHVPARVGALTNTRDAVLTTAATGAGLGLIIMAVPTLLGLTGGWAFVAAAGTGAAVGVGVGVLADMLANAVTS